MPKLGGMQSVKMKSGKQMGKRIGKMKSMFRKAAKAGGSAFGFKKKGY